VITSLTVLQAFSDTVAAYQYRSGIFYGGSMDNRLILSEFKSLLEKEFPGMVSKVILYGSRVTGQARDGSDYDFLVILKNDMDWKARKRINDAAYEIDLKRDILIDVKVMTEADMNSIRGRQPFVLDAVEYGVAA
jgi:predicted nucleotidyltransferase